MFEFQAEELKGLNANGGGNLGCILGSSYGGCSCCLGGCALDVCIGICA